MNKNTVYCCSCFIDKSVWFVNNEWRLWMFDKFFYVNGRLSEQIFVYNKKMSSMMRGDASVLLATEIYVCCMDCFEFHLSFLSSEERMIDVFNEIDCRFIAWDSFCYETDIYIGNDQFIESNRHLSNRERSELYKLSSLKMKKIFKILPRRKSCFTSLQKQRYEFFCDKCKKIFDNYFSVKLHSIKNNEFVRLQR